MIQWYKSSWSEIVKLLESNIYSGLDGDDINIKREKYGANKILIPKTKSLYSIIINQIKEPWVIMLSVCLIIFLYFTQFILAGIMLLVIMMSILPISLDKYNNEKSIKELESLNIGNARVVRDGRTFKIPLEELVIGDIVIVGQGEGVPADLRVIESEDLKVNETSVTGEKYVAEKYETKIEDKEITLSDMKNILFKSSFVVGGSGTGIVIATGMNTQIANMVKLFFSEEDKSTEVGKKVHEIINYFCIFVISALMINISLRIVSKENIKQMVYISAEFVLNSIPQGIVIILSVVSLFLLKKMKKSSIEFKDLSIIEKLSSISVICTDKVGSFSKNKMEVAKIFTNGNFIDVISDVVNGSSNEGDIENLQRMLHIGLLCNDTQVSTGKLINPKEDLMEAAIIKFAMMNGLDKRNLDRQHKRVVYIPFDNDRKILTTINSVDENYRANIKGSVDSIINKCTHIMKNGVELDITEDEINAIRSAGVSMSAECLSVVGFAYRNFNYEPSVKENIESNLVFVGLIGFENMLKSEAIDSIARSEMLNIKPIIITDDNKLTAFAIGKKMKLVSKVNEIISGVEIDNMPSDEFDRIGDKIGIFSKINSKHKVKIIKALKSYGHTTAIVGSKLIDLPALRVSDIGITTSTSKMVKKLSDIILKDIGFMRILNMLEDSRRIINLLKKIIVYIISCATAMLIFTSLVSLRKYNVPLMYIESFWFNNILMIISSMALAIQYKYEDVKCTNYKLDKDVIKENKPFIIFNGSIMGMGAFIVLMLTYSKGTAFAQVTSFTTLNLSAVFFTLSFSKTKLFQNKFSNLILGLNLLLQFGIMVLMGGLHVILSVDYWEITLAILAICIVISLFNKLGKEQYYD